jgi:hypothetical protein
MRLDCLGSEECAWQRHVRAVGPITLRLRTDHLQGIASGSLEMVRTLVGRASETYISLHGHRRVRAFCSKTVEDDPSSQVRVLLRLVAIETRGDRRGRSACLLSLAKRDWVWDPLDRY